MAGDYEIGDAQMTGTKTLDHHLNVGEADMPECPVCRLRSWHHLFRTRSHHLYQCEGCGVFFRAISGAYQTTHQSSPESGASDAAVDAVAEQCLTVLGREGLPQGNVLVIGDFLGQVAAAASRVRGYTVTSRVTLADDGGGEQFDACILFSLTDVTDPGDALRRAKRSLKPAGLVVIVTHLTDSWVARLFGTNWHAWNLNYSYYFSRSQLHNLLLGLGFAEAWFRPGTQRITVSQAARQLSQMNSTALRLLGAVGERLPTFLQRRLPPFLPTTRTVVSARVDPIASRPTLSILIPVYNERNTFPELMERVLAKHIEGVTREIILVESNSSDGTRDLVREFETHPEVRVFYEDRPRGKGLAVRTALAQAQGDIVIIQDADLEYDIDDYDAILEPLLARQEMFVLGSRHRGDWKIRRFDRTPLKALVLNTAHKVLCGLINLLYRQQLTDPFTMYKLFYRDCVYGIDFKCRLFDFDHEILIKLVRKGYTPREVPVNYVARTFAEGKKIRFVRDGVTAVLADIRFRFERISSKE